MEDKDRLILRTSGCKPLSHEQLKARMGAYFDENKMRLDDADDIKDDAKRGSWRHSVIDDDEIVQEDTALDMYSSDSTNDIRRQNTDTTSVHNIKFMRRKRNAEYSTDSDSTFLYQNLLFDTISKRKSREKRSPRTKFPPAWNCEKENRWRKTKKGYFPSQVLDGKCSQKSCFFHQYKCNPVKYA